MDQLFEEMKGRVLQRDQAVPARRGAYWYGSRTEEGKQYPIFFRRAAQGPNRVYDEKVAEEPMLDLNELATTRVFVALNGMAVSPTSAGWLCGGRDWCA